MILSSQINTGKCGTHYSKKGKDAYHTCCYSHPRGRPRLRNAIAASYEPEFGRKLNPETEILVTAGANEAMFATFAGYLNDGDEVICIEPFFDQYIVSHGFVMRVC